MKNVKNRYLENIFEGKFREIKSIYAFEKWFSKIFKDAILSGEFSALLINSPRLTRKFENGTELVTILESEANFEEKEFGFVNEIDLHWRSGNETFIAGTNN